MQICAACRQKLALFPSARPCAECRLLAWPGVKVLLVARIEDCLNKDPYCFVEVGSGVGAAWQAYLIACSSVKRLVEADRAPIAIGASVIAAQRIGASRLRPGSR